MRVIQDLIVPQVQVPLPSKIGIVRVVLTVRIAEHIAVRFEPVFLYVNVTDDPRAVSVLLEDAVNYPRLEVGGLRLPRGATHPDVIRRYHILADWLPRAG